jgi:hypothetical protein
MTDPTPTPPGDHKKNSRKIKHLVWIGVVLAGLVLFEIGDLIMHIAHPTR